MKPRFLLLALASFTLATIIGCNNSSSTPASASAASTLAVTTSSLTNPATVSAGMPLTITPIGGTPPYSFSLLSNIGGTLSVPVGTTTIYTAGTTSGTVEVSVTDSLGLNTLIQISVTGGANGVLNISPLNTSVLPGGSIVFTATGGIAPYNYMVLSGGGSFSLNTYLAPLTSGIVTIQISDSGGNSSQTTIDVTSSATATVAGSCSGSYTLSLDGAPGTLIISEDASGNIFGDLALNQIPAFLPTAPAYIQGSCSSTGTISFTDYYSQSVYSGSFFTNPSTGQIIMYGTIADGSGSTWFAQGN